MIYCYCRVQSLLDDFLLIACPDILHSAFFIYCPTSSLFHFFQKIIIIIFCSQTKSVIDIFKTTLYNKIEIKSKGRDSNVLNSFNLYLQTRLHIVILKEA